MDFDDYFKELYAICYDELLFNAMPKLISIHNEKVFLYDVNAKDYLETDQFDAEEFIYHDWSLFAGYENKSRLKNRHDFDEAVFPSYFREHDPMFIHDKISARETYKLFDTTLSIKNEKDPLKEEELFNQEMIKIYGDSDDDEIDPVTHIKICTFHDFKMLSYSGNQKIGSAERGTKYLFFFWMY